MKRTLSFRKVAFALIAVCFSTNAFGWGDTYHRSGTVLAQDFRINLSAGGIGVAHVKYVVEAAYSIQEGNGTFGRNCQFVPVSRTLTRSVTIEAKGQTMPIADAHYMVPLLGKKSFNDACSEHATGDVSEFWSTMDEAVGNADTWHQRIIEDRQSLKDSVSLVGSLVI